MTIEAPTKPVAAERPTVAERLTSASTSSDLSVDLEKRGDADYLIAAGIQRAVLGRLVQQLICEWDRREKPRPLTDEQLQRVAEQMPRKSRGRLDMVGARVAEGRWHMERRMEILRGLPQYTRLVDAHAGFLPWVLAQGIKDARAKLTDVLLWWCDSKCPGCGGLKLGEMAICETCKGFGTRDVPHEAEGLLISEHISDHVDRARSGTIAALKRMKGLKVVAAGKG
ncbi:hypothetical protein N5C96_23345 [Delftia tsuruhatensis]|uniref:hypothetical protein n=1 Tax=Delftia tsuruhatensis TaxID=180282 RepID=UPI002443B55A|nr:hypothetical protein [Delftia tsuruhatensis]MDH0776349.1 hypothetical protein [Delftia tsuruhatensis]MDH1460096.1 hypothetical protein [Delftia tsuruhatensis]MDH1823059.1 hypothetical protein [Delftia tsuruhatensis]WGG12265.1 hypothetical protein N5O86_06375 [Delftia tsuruhatensis]